MSTRTKPNEKFAKARQFIRERDAIKANLPNYSNMGWRTLYRALALIGVEWSKQERVWYLARVQDTAPHVTVKSPKNRTGNTRETVLVRIITDRSNIEQVTADMVELVEALNMTVIKQAEPINSHYGDSQRVYLTLRINKTNGQ